MNFKISDIEINNFYSFKDAKFQDIKDYNVIIGKNNAGKSNLFRLLSNFIGLFNGAKIEQNYLFNENINLDAYLSITFNLSEEYRKELFKYIYNEGQLSNAFSRPNDCPEEWNENALQWLIEEGFYFKVEIKFGYYNKWKSLILNEINAFHKVDSISSTLLSQDKNDPSGLKFYLIEKSNFTQKENLRDFFLTTLNSNKFTLIAKESYIVNHFNSILSTLVDVNSIIYNPLLSKILADILSLFKDNFIHPIPAFRKFMRANDLDDLEKAIISSDGSNISKLLASKKQNETTWHNEINEDFIDFFEEIEEFTSRIEQNSTIMHLKEKGLDCIFRLENIGGGILNIVHFLIYLKYLGQNKIILIEEPELFIFPGLQKKLREKLLNFSNTNQVFITTHSPNFLTRNFKKCSIYKINKEANHSVIDKISNDDLLDVFKELELSFYDYILYDGILFVEGPKDIEVFKIINEEFFENNLKLIPTEGKNNFIHYASTNIIKFLDNNNFDFLFIMDRDRGNRDFYKRINDKEAKELVKKRIVPLFTYEIENLFLQPLLLLDFLHSTNKIVSLKDDSMWISDLIENNFKLYTLNNYEYLLKKFNETLNPKLSNIEIKEILNSYDDRNPPKEISEFLYERINHFMKKKLQIFENPSIDFKKFKTAMVNIQWQYNDLLNRNGYNKILSGKKILKIISNKIIDKYQIGNFSLETLSRHLISFLIDLNNFLSEKKYNDEEYDHLLLDKNEISKFGKFINDIIELLTQIKIKTHSRFNIKLNVSEIKKTILIQFLINRWNLEY